MAENHKNKINMDEFVTVVTSFKCKFCRFMSQHKIGLYSHIRYCHKNKLEAATEESSGTAEKNDNATHQSNVTQEPPKEPHQSQITIPANPSVQSWKQSWATESSEHNAQYPQQLYAVHLEVPSQLQWQDANSQVILGQNQQPNFHLQHNNNEIQVSQSSFVLESSTPMPNIYGQATTAASNFTLNLDYAVNCDRPTPAMLPCTSLPSSLQAVDFFTNDNINESVNMCSSESAATAALDTAVPHTSAMTENTSNTDETSTGIDSDALITNCNFQQKDAENQERTAMTHNHEDFAVPQSDSGDVEHTEANPETDPDELEREPESNSLDVATELVEERVTNLPNDPTELPTESVLNSDGDATELEKESDTHRSDTLYICGICSAEFENREVCSKHVNEHTDASDVDSGAEKATQTKPLKKAFSKRKMKQATKSESDSDTDAESSKEVKKWARGTYIDPTILWNYSCKLTPCKAIFREKKQLTYHKKCHSSNTEYVCPECNEFSTSRWRVFQNHLWVKHKVDSGLYNCSYCTYKTESATYFMKVHLPSHGTERPFRCRQCSKGFKNQHLRQQHESNVHGIGRRAHAVRRVPATCDKCHKQFADKNSLRKHYSAIHLDHKPHKCHHCDYATTRNNRLLSHIRTHTGEKPFKCTECDFRTYENRNLIRHAKRHSGEKPYKCSYCSYACIQSTAFKTHLRTKHAGVPLAYNCLYCAFRCMTLSRIHEHITKSHPQKPQPDESEVAVMQKEVVHVEIAQETAETLASLAASGNSQTHMAVEHIQQVMDTQQDDSTSQGGNNIQLYTDHIDMAMYVPAVNALLSEANGQVQQQVYQPDVAINNESFDGSSATQVVYLIQPS